MATDIKKPDAVTSPAGENFPDGIPPDNGATPLSSLPDKTTGGVVDPGREGDVFVKEVIRHYDDVVGSYEKSGITPDTKDDLFKLISARSRQHPGFRNQFSLLAKRVMNLPEITDDQLADILEEEWGRLSPSETGGRPAALSATIARLRNELAGNRIRAALKKARTEVEMAKLLGGFPPHTFFGRNRTVLAGLSEQWRDEAMDDMLVVGPGYDKGYPHTTEVYEWLTCLPQVKRLLAIDGNLWLLKWIEEKKNPEFKVEPDLYKSDPEYRNYVHRFVPPRYDPLSYLRDSNFYLPANERLPGKISTMDLNFLTDPLPEKKHDLIVCLNVLQTLTFNRTDKTLARAFVFQLADALKPGGRLVLHTRSPDGEGVPFTEEEALALGLERRVESFGTPFNTFIFTKIGDGTPLLRELAEKIKAELRTAKKPAPPKGGPKGGGNIFFAPQETTETAADPVTPFDTRRLGQTQVHQGAANDDVVGNPFWTPPVVSASSYMGWNPAMTPQSALMGNAALAAGAALAPVMAPAGMPVVPVAAPAFL
ncbi:MAG: hypothetical protein HYU99_12170 [Deltaproteobacteria bacterium]|nr:hypothetical protein [Deltaproteobacteria bacterium]